MFFLFERNVIWYFWSSSFANAWAVFFITLLDKENKKKFCSDTIYGFTYAEEKILFIRFRWNVMRNLTQQLCSHKSILNNVVITNYVKC